MEKKKVIFFLLLVIGVVLRVYNVDGVPAGVFADEIALGINARTLAESGVDEFGNPYPFGFESFSDYKLPGYIYSAMLSYLVFGPTTFAIRFPAVLASVVSVFLIGYLAFLLFPKRGLLPYAAMLVIAFSPMHIHFGRIAYETMLATMFFLIYLICLLQCIYKARPHWLIIGVISLLLSTWTYHSPRLIIPVFTFSLFVYIFFVKPEKINRKNALLSISGFILAALISFVPFLFNREIDKRPFSYITGGSVTGFIPSLLQKGEVAISSWLRMWNIEFLFTKGDLFGFRHGTGESGLFLSIFFVPLIAGIIAYIKEFSIKNFSLIFLLLLFITTGLPSALTNIFPYAPRVLPVLIPFTLLIAYGVDVLFSKISKYSPVIRWSTAFVVSLLFIYQITQFAHIYSAHFSHKSLPEFPDAPVSVSRYVKQTKEADAKQRIYFLNGNVCLPWGYDELKLWYFADLDNADMIKWNQLYRKQRFATGNPFGSFEDLPRPMYTLDTITLHADEDTIAIAPAGSLIVRCGVHLPNIDIQNEKIVKIFYMYENEKRDPVYVVSEKKK